MLVVELELGGWPPVGGDRRRTELAAMLLAELGGWFTKSAAIAARRARGMPVVELGGWFTRSAAIAGLVNQLGALGDWSPGRRRSLACRRYGRATRSRSPGMSPGRRGLPQHSIGDRPLRQRSPLRQRGGGAWCVGWRHLASAGAGGIGTMSAP